MYLALDIPAFVMYCGYGESGSSLLIESTDSIIRQEDLGNKGKLIMLKKYLSYNYSIDYNCYYSFANTAVACYCTYLIC